MRPNNCLLSDRAVFYRYVPSPTPRFPTISSPTCRFSHRRGTPSDGSAEPRIPGCRWPLAWALRFVSRVSISLYLIATLQGISKCLLRHCHFVGGQSEPSWWGLSFGWRSTLGPALCELWVRLLFSSFFWRRIKPNT